MKGPAKLGSVIIGPHCPMTNWVFDAVTELANTRDARPVLRIDRKDRICGLGVADPVFLTNYPSQSVIEAIDAGDLRVIIVIEDPRDVLRWQNKALGLPALESIRAQSASAVANLAVARADAVAIVDRSNSRRADSVLDRIGSFLGLPTVDPERSGLLAHSPEVGGAPAIEEVLAARGDHYAPPLAQSGGAGLLSVEAAALSSCIIDPMVAMARGDAVRPVVWPASVFTFSDRPGDPAPVVADIAGPPRSIYYGPYLYLPPARYRVEAIMTFSDEIQDVPFVLEVHGGHWLARARIERRRAGGYRGYFEFDHLDALPALEIRLRNEEGIDRGRLSLIELLFFAMEPGSAM